MDSAKEKMDNGVPENGDECEKSEPTDQDRLNDGARVSLEVELDDLHAQLRALQSQKEEASVRVQTLSTDMERLVVESVDLKQRAAEADELKKIATTAKADVARLAKDKAELETRVAKERENAKTQLAAIKKKMEDLKKEKADAGKENKKGIQAAKERDDAIAQLGGLATEIEQLKKERAGLEEATEKVRVAARTREEELTAQLEVADAVTSEATAWSAELETLRTESIGAAEKLEVAQTESKRLEKKNADLASKVEAASSRGEAGGQADQAVQVGEEYLSELEQVRRERDELNDRVMALETNDDLEKEIEQHKLDAAMAATKLETLQQQNKELVQKLSNIQESLQIAKETIHQRDQHLECTEERSITDIAKTTEDAWRTKTSRATQMTQTTRAIPPKQ